MLLATFTGRLNISATAGSSRLRPSGSCWRSSNRLFTAAAQHKLSSSSEAKACYFSLTARQKCFHGSQVQQGRRGFSLKVQDATSSSNAPFQRIAEAFNRVPHIIVVIGLVVVNVSVWYAWKSVVEELKNGISKKSRVMDLLFVQTSGNLLGNRPWALITSCFSHLDGHALARDMLPVLMTALQVARIAGNSVFLAVYLAGGVSSRILRYIQSMLDSECQKLSATNVAMIDSGGSAAALMSVHICLLPFIKRWGGELQLFLTAYALIHGTWCLLCIVTDAGNNFPKEAHVTAAGWLGGAVGGVLFYFIKIRPQLYRRLQYGL